MKKFWKIKNIANFPVKFTVRIDLNAPGIILQPNQFCIGEQQMTAPLDKQSKCKFVTIEDFDNSYYTLKLGIAYDETVLDKAIDNTNQYCVNP